MDLIWEILISFCLVVGGFFGIVGSVGLIKLPDPMSRLHAPTKASTLGVGGVLIASMIWFAAFGDGFSFHELLITLFLFLTAPITAHFLAKANMHREWSPEALPEDTHKSGWAIFTPGADTAAQALADEQEDPIGEENDA
jgi:multicomponent K+:H+ antiporter subunit G